MSKALLMKYSIQHRMQGNHGNDNPVKRSTDWHFPRRIFPAESKLANEMRLCKCWQDCDVARPTTQKRTS